MEDVKIIKKLTDYEEGKTIFLAFPYAGVGASFYYSWQKLLQDVCQVWAVQLPGREERMGDGYYTDIKEVAELVVQQIENVKCPIVIYGHSMGTKIAYEVERRLEVLHKDVKLIIVSGCGIPTEEEPEFIAHLPDDVFIEKVMGYNGIPTELAEDKEIVKFFLPTLRADFVLSESYKCEELNRGNVPVRAMGGTEDTEADENAMKKWKKLNPENFEYKMYEGSHFFIKEKQHMVVDQIIDWIIEIGD